jgi:AbiJ-like protein
MKLFSHRHGLKPVKNVIQIDSIDDDLRNRLWDSLKLFYWDIVHCSKISDINRYGGNSEKGVALLIHDFRRS